MSPREPVTGTLVSLESVLAPVERLSAAKISAHFNSSLESGSSVLEGIAMLNGESGG